MAADDFLNIPPDQGLPADLDTTSAYSGNRPASGARRATPGEVLSQGFQGDQNAGDFLGLDTEFTASQLPNQGYGSGAPLDLVPPPTSTPDAQDGYAPVAEPAPLPASDPVQEFAQAPSAFEFGEDLGSDEGEALPGSAGAASKKPLLVGALLVAGLVTGGVLYGPRLAARFFPSKTEVAKAPKDASEPKAARAAKTPAAETNTSAVDPVAAPSSAAKASAPDSPLVVEKPALASRPTPSRVPEPPARVELASKTEPNEETAALVATVGATPRPTAFPDLSGSAYEWASEDQLELIWRGSEVPLEAVKAPAKTLMPRVGNVRVFTTAGDVFEGRLYAVGQNRVWLDAGPGRIGLDGEHVERIDVLPPQAEGQRTSGDPADFGGGKRVRVRVPGGMLYGRVLKSEGEEVTLALDDGGRVRVKAVDIQDLGSGRAVVVRR